MKFAVPFALLVIVAGVLWHIVPVQAQTAAPSDVQAKITANNNKISTLQQEIAAYQKQLNSISSQKQTLQSAIKSIEITRAQTAAQVALTQSKIDAENLALQKLGTQINSKQASIDQDRETLAASLRKIDIADHTPFITLVLSSNTLADSWTTVGAEMMLSEALQSHAKNLATDKVQLSGQQSQVADSKNQLTTLNTSLHSQEGQLDATKKSKEQLLSQTKSQESTYQQLIATKKAQQKAFESELTALENSLKAVSSSQIPHTGKGILQFPFSASVMQSCAGKSGALGNIYCITQYFGNTAFSTANASIYNGHGHNAIDIGVPSGTPVLAAAAGTVAGTGNTDLVPGCYSFGKWVMVQHANGLDTLYAHLSVIGVSKGQAVGAGDQLGYSGMTGYATGPHLHFGVYASAGVQFLTLNQFRGATSGCANAQMPVAPQDAYLNPLSYL